MPKKKKKVSSKGKRRGQGPPVLAKKPDIAVVENENTRAKLDEVVRQSYESQGGPDEAELREMSAAGYTRRDGQWVIDHDAKPARLSHTGPLTTVTDIAVQSYKLECIHLV